MISLSHFGDKRLRCPDTPRSPLPCLPDRYLIFVHFFFADDQHIGNLRQFRIPDLLPDLFTPVVDLCTNIRIFQAILKEFVHNPGTYR